MVFGFVAVYQLRQNFIIVLLVLGGGIGIAVKKCAQIAQGSAVVPLGSDWFESFHVYSLPR